MNNKRGEILEIRPKKVLNTAQHNSGYVELSKALDKLSYPKQVIIQSFLLNPLNINALFWNYFG